MSSFLKIPLLFVATVLSLYSASADEKIVLGVSSALTGGAATYGVDIKNILTFANQKLYQNRYEFVFEDDKCNGRDAVTAAQKFINILHVRAVVGFACSGTILASAPLYEKSKTIALVLSGSAPAISQSGEYIFRTWPSDTGAAEVLAARLSAKHHKVGVLSEQTEYAQGLLDAVSRNAKILGLELESESFISDVADFRSLLLKIRSRGVEGLFINSQAELSFLAILKQVKEMNLAVPVYGAYYPGSRTLLEKAGPEMVEGIEFVDGPTPEEIFTEDGKSIYEEFKKEFGAPQSVPFLFATVLEGMRAIDAAYQSGKDLREYLSSASFEGFFGPWKFDQNGDIVGLRHVMRVVLNGEPSILPTLSDPSSAVNALGQTLSHSNPAN